jgi:hypothetical protein
LSRFVDGILVGLGIALIVVAGAMYILLTTSTANIEAKTEATSQTGSQWVIVVAQSNTTVTATGTIPSLHVTVPSVQQYATFLMSIFQLVGFFGVVFLLSGILTSIAEKERKTPTPSSD